jgi:hypothetical protein
MQAIHEVPHHPLISATTSSTNMNYYFQSTNIQGIHTVLFVWPSRSHIIRSNILHVFYLNLPLAYQFWQHNYYM